LKTIERLWLDLKIDLCGENFANLDQLRQAIREILSYMIPEWMADFYAVGNTLTAQVQDLR
jgi:hypothetical protein